MAARVVAVAASARHGFTKPVCAAIRLLAGLGVEGDAHLGVTVQQNLKHDFPQRVGCERKGTALQAWTEGPAKGQNKRIEYAYRRVPCGGTD